MFKHIIKTTTATVLLSISAGTFAADIDISTDANDLAIKGYDPVAYFTESQPTKGVQGFTATYKNAIYQFSSVENRDLFKANPTKYAPEFGGFCAYGVTKGRKFNTDPTAWRIVDGKLYLNLNHDVQQDWLKDIPGNITVGNDTWTDIRSFSDQALQTF